ncbi:hypothetical protein [Streptomyces sp. YKOK-I1]
MLDPLCEEQRNMGINVRVVALEQLPAHHRPELVEPLLRRFEQLWEAAGDVQPPPNGLPPGGIRSLTGGGDGADT